MHLAVPSELCRDIPQLLVHKTEKTHPALQCGLGRGVLEDHIVQPLPVPVAPMVIVESLRLLDAEIQQLHLDIALDPTEIFDQIVPATK